MTPRLPNQALPAELCAGDALAFAVQTSLPATSFVFLVLNGVIGNVATRIRIGGDSGVAVDASGLAAFNVPGSTTSAYLPGRYQWTAFSLDAGGNRAQMASGRITITPDVAGAVAVDPRSWAERVLANLRAVVEGKSTDDVMMYKIGGRELTKLSPSELLKQIAIFETIVRRERIRKGERVARNTVGVRFG